MAVSSPDNSNAFAIGPFRPVATGVPAALPDGPQIKDNGSTSTRPRSPERRNSNSAMSAAIFQTCATRRTSD